MNGITSILPSDTVAQAMAAQMKRKVATPRRGARTITLSAGGVDLHVRLRVAPGADRLLVTFHGGVDRARATLPVFNGFIDDLPGTHQLSVSDPSLGCDSALRLAWHAGHEGFDTPAVLRAVIAATIQQLKVVRTAFFGTSGGGFAALVQSHAVPGSIVVVANPQTAIERYHPRQVASYRAACWPELPPEVPLDSVTVADCARLYAGGFDNTVIYALSLGDGHHMRHHMLPFVAAIAHLPAAQRLLLHTDYDGNAGHHMARSHYLPWLRAALTATDTAPASLLTMWHSLRDAPLRPLRPGRRRPAPVSPPFAPSDLAAGERVAAWLAGTARESSVPNHNPIPSAPTLPVLRKEHA
ncbi:hypothetical protein [Novosphingobium sp.]|uniref:hypothetical protein n=1 Tax=Novosphingobium sp. TaxID=1874826 RepID=UPI002FDEEFBE